MADGFHKPTNLEKRHRDLMADLRRPATAERRRLRPEDWAKAGEIVRFLSRVDKPTEGH